MGGGADTAAAESPAETGAARGPGAARLPLAGQLAKLERILGDRVRHYRTGVNKGRLTLEAAAAKHDECMAILASFRWLAANEAWIRAAAAERAAQRARAEAHARLLADVECDPAVAEVLAAFPGAEITSMRDFDGEDVADLQPLDEAET